MSSKMFNEAELEKLATPLSIRLEQDIEKRDFDDIWEVRLWMDRECIAIHDAYMKWISILQSYIGKNLGEDRLGEAMVWMAENSYKSLIWDRRYLNFRQRVEYMASRSRSSGTTFWITEDEDKVTFKMDPCGMSQRLLGKEADLPKEIVKASSSRNRYPYIGGHEPPETYLFCQEPGPLSLGKKNFPIFCEHCVLFGEVIPIDLWGFPLFTINTPKEDVCAGPCFLTMYKDPRDIPEEVYWKVGKVKPKSFSRKEEKTKRVFREEELETMAIPLSLRLETWLKTKDTSKPPDLIREMDNDLIVSNDPNAIAIAALLTYIARNMGEQEVEKVLHSAASPIMMPFVKQIKENFKGDKKKEVAFFSMLWRAHGSTFSVFEDDEKFITYGTPLGKCHRLYSSPYQKMIERISPTRIRYPTYGIYEAPRSLHLMQEPRGITYHNKNYPIYSSHCHMLHEHWPIEERGYPLWVEIHPLGDPDHTPSFNLNYKEPDKWPDKYYKMFGKSK